MPFDSYQRDINYLRISITDHCNLRCVYCMPVNGLHFLPREHLLTPEEIASVVRAAVSVGFRKFRLTGGEPTLRPDLLDIVRLIAQTDGAGELSMTTNAILLPGLAQPLAEAGLRRVNIHLDTLRPDRLGGIMRWGRLEDIWRGIEAAEQAGLRPIKLNAVIARGHNDMDVAELAALTVDRDWHIRFVEMMPFGNGECDRVATDQYVSNEETRARIEQKLGLLTPIERKPSRRITNPTLRLASETRYSQGECSSPRRVN